MTAARNPDTLIRAFLDEGLVELPDRAFDAVRRDIHRTRQRGAVGQWANLRTTGAFRAAVAAVVLVAVGFAWGSVRTPADPGQSTEPTGGPTASPRALPTERAALEPVPYVLDYGFAPGSDQVPGTKVVVTVPSAAWTTDGAYSIERNAGPDDVQADASFVAWRLSDIPVDPCTNHAPVTPPPGAGVDDILVAIAGQAGIAPGPITDISLDGFAGRFVEVQVSTNVDACPDGFLMWASDGRQKFASLRGEVFRIYAVEVEGDRLTFFARVPRLITPVLGAAQARDELASLIASIDIVP